MVWRFLTLATVLVVSLSGCNQSTPEPTSATAGPADNSAEIATAEGSDADSAPATDRPVAAIVSKPASDHEDSFVPPYPENAAFFSPPDLPPAAPELVPENKATDEAIEEPGNESRPLDLRVIGFVQVAGEPPKALLHLDGKLEIVTPGDELGDAQVVDVNEPRISVLRNGETVQFVLDEISKKSEIAARRPQPNGVPWRDSERPRERSAGPDSEVATLPVPIDFDALPGIPGPPVDDLPEIDLPDPSPLDLDSL